MIYCREGVMRSSIERPLIASAWEGVEYHIRIPDQLGLQFTPPDYRALNQEKDRQANTWVPFSQWNKDQGHLEERQAKFGTPGFLEDRQADHWSLLNQEKSKQAKDKQICGLTDSQTTAA